MRPPLAWDTEGTKRKIKEAATAEFAQYGPDGTTVEHIAKKAGVNKERVYNYFGGKRKLFATILRDELATVAQAVPATSFATEDIGDYAGRVYDYHCERPELIRLLRWEALVFDNDAAQLMMFILSIAGWWSTVPQVARMLCGPLSEEEHARRRAAIVQAARRLATPGASEQNIR